MEEVLQVVTYLGVLAEGRGEMAEGSVVDGLVNIDVTSRVKTEEGLVSREGVTQVKSEEGLVNVEGVSQVKTEEGLVNVEGVSQVKIEEGYTAEEEDDDDDVEESSAVLKARRLAVPNEVNRRKQRRVFRSATRQKYSFDRDSGLLSTYHRSKLRCLLSAHVQQRQRHRAAGVLGVLLGIPYASLKPGKVEEFWSDFAAAMEVLQRIHSVGSNDLKLRRMFRLLQLRQPNARYRGKVQVELALYLMSVGDREAAYNELRPIVDSKHHREDPVANLCHGANSYHLWYEKAIEDVSTMEITEIGLHIASQLSDPIEGIGENDDQNIQPEWGKTRQGSFGDGFGLRDLQLSGAATQHGRNDMQLDELDATACDVNIWQASQKSIYEETDEQGFLQTGEEFWRSVIVSNSQGLDRRLFPVQVPQDIDQKHYIVPMKDGRTKDLHTAAVKHLKQALARFDMLPALFPLVQLLLAVHDIKGAADEIDKCAQALKNHFIPPSIKVVLLESLDQKDPARFAICYRDVLIRNPSSVSSLKGLVNLHVSVDLETRLLLECICLHLDISPGAIDTWQKLASCLLEAEGELGRLSGAFDDVELVEGGMEEHPEQLSRDYLRRLWSCRYKWWLRKHFSTQGSGVEEQPNGASVLLAYKAACAAHIYGPGECFVEQTCKALENQHHEALKYIVHHCGRSLKLFGEQL